MSEIHLDPESLAARTGVPLKTVYDWNSKKTGPRYMRLGRHVRYKLADVIAWENSRYADGPEAA
jgi:predicted DNA-binding transcriptional regulator AlpA